MQKKPIYQPPCFSFGANGEALHFTVHAKVGVVNLNSRRDKVNNTA